MITSVEGSRMKIVFRVMATESCLKEFEMYTEAEKFCWAFDGDLEIHIEKVWVLKDVAE